MRWGFGGKEGRKSEKVLLRIGSLLRQVDRYI